MKNGGLQTSKLNDRKFLCLVGNMTYLNYVIQIQYYPLIFSRLHDAFLQRDAFFKGATDYPMIPIVFWVNCPPNLLRFLWLWKLNDAFSRRSSSIPNKSESGNWYFFFWSSFNVDRLLDASCKGELLSYSSFGLLVIHTSPALEMDKSSFIDYRKTQHFS